MRAAEFENLEPITWMIGNVVGCMSAIDAVDINEAHRLCKNQERYVINYMRIQQKSQQAGFDGYYVMNGVMYKVFYGNNDVKKITGEEARSMKRLLKQRLSVEKPEPVNTDFLEQEGVAA